MKGLYALPPGADFARDFVAGLVERYHAQPPEALAQVTLWLNSARTLNAVREAFDLHGARLLPQMRLIADLGGGAVEAPLARMLDLAALIEAAAAYQPAMVAGQSIPALAQSLANLMAEMQLEGCTPENLDDIDVGDHAAHWQQALRFLRIAAGAYLDGAPIDRESRQRSVAEDLAHAWAMGKDLPKGPVIVAGSTGSHGATRLFMQAVAGLEQGAVVLPGFDFDQPADLWRRLAEEGGEEHPQARFAPLVAQFGQPRPWVAVTPDDARNRLVSLALRPAPVTDQWVAEGPDLGDLIAASEKLALIEADQPQTEADSIAIAMRESVARGEAVTLIAADRGLTRRVTAALDRWRLIPDDSAGRPLSLSPTGLFLRALVALNGRPLGVEGLLILLKNKVTASGSECDHLLHTRELELRLRAEGPAFPDAAFLRDWGINRRRPHRKPWADWLADALDTIMPLAGDRDARPLPDRLAELCALAEALSAGPDGDAQTVWAGEAGQLARGVMDGLARAAKPDHRMHARDFAALVAQRLDGQALRSTPGAHPLVRIRGPREARTDAVGVVILGGLNEGGWPQSTAPDPWLSRAMRLQAGLTLPERVTGLSAHDFQQGLAASRVILSRAHRDADAETVPSRWLNRLTNLMGGLPDQGGRKALASMRERGNRWLDLAACLATPRAEVRAENPPARRPKPVPPPNSLDEISVTQVATLIRDPYAIYAQKILRLRGLNPLRPRPDDPRLRGILLHKIAEAVTRGIAAIGPDAAALEAFFHKVAAEQLDKLVPWLAERVFLAARLNAIAPRLAADDAARLQVQKPMVIENAGGKGLPLSNMRLIARPDRLDLTEDGTVWVYDYKSGTPPTDKQVASFEKQLPLTAALVLYGAFPGLDQHGLAGAAYIHLGGEGATQPRDVTEESAMEAWQRLDRLLVQYQDGSAGFTALRAPAMMRFVGDYAHLARYGEWTLADEGIAEKVGIWA